MRWSKEKKGSFPEKTWVLDDKLKWDAAMHQEWKSLIDNTSWELVEALKGKQVVESTWVHLEKNDAIVGAEEIFKARFVARGFTQRMV